MFKFRGYQTVLRFCLESNSPQEPPAQSPPPLSSLFVYMLLTETLDIDDKISRKELAFPVTNWQSALMTDAAHSDPISTCGSATSLCTLRPAPGLCLVPHVCLEQISNRHQVWRRGRER